MFEKTLARLTTLVPGEAPKVPGYTWEVRGEKKWSYSSMEIFQVVLLNHDGGVVQREDIHNGFDAVSRKEDLTWRNVRRAMLEIFCKIVDESENKKRVKARRESGSLWVKTYGRTETTREEQDG